MIERAYFIVCSVCTPVILTLTKGQSTCSFISLKAAGARKLVCGRSFSVLSAFLTVFSDDVMMWINGGAVYRFATLSFVDVQLTGPGCSSGMGLLFELGLSIILYVVIHPNSWKTRSLQHRCQRIVPEWYYMEPLLVE